jgi:hypothetical protein
MIVTDDKMNKMLDAATSSTSEHDLARSFDTKTTADDLAIAQPTYPTRWTVECFSTLSRHARFSILNIARPLNHDVGLGVTALTNCDPPAYRPPQLGDDNELG